MMVLINHLPPADIDNACKHIGVELGVFDVAEVLGQRFAGYGSTEDLEGRVWLDWLQQVDADTWTLVDFRVVTYIQVKDRWWSRPSGDKQLTRINAYLYICSFQAQRNPTGYWICDITTQSGDDRASKIVTYLIPASYKPPLTEGSLWLPQELEDTALAKAEASRSVMGKVFIKPVVEPGESGIARSVNETINMENAK